MSHETNIDALAAPLVFLARRAVAAVAIAESQRAAARYAPLVELRKLDAALLDARDAAAAATLEASREARDAGCHECAKQWAQVHGEQFHRAAMLRERIEAGR